MKVVGFSIAPVAMSGALAQQTAPAPLPLAGVVSNREQGVVKRPVYSQNQSRPLKRNAGLLIIRPRRSLPIGVVIPDPTTGPSDPPRWGHFFGSAVNSGVKRKRPPTEAALFPGHVAVLFTHQRVVPVNLASKSRPAASEIFQSMGFSLTPRRFHQATTFC